MALNEEVKSDLSATKKALSPKQKKTIILLSVVGVLFLAIVGIFVSMAINKAVRGNCIIEKAEDGDSYVIVGVDNKNLTSVEIPAVVKNDDGQVFTVTEIKATSNSSSSVNAIFLKKGLET